MRELRGGATGAGGMNVEANPCGALAMPVDDEDLLQRLLDFTLEHGPTLMDFGVSLGAEAHASRC